MRECKTCVYMTADGCAAWKCEYINRQEAIEAWETLKAMRDNMSKTLARVIAANMPKEE